jgi:hypothetical protein
MLLQSNKNRNTALLRQLPQGFTATATNQIAGRGRGSNVWVSPAGSLIFSTVVRHPMEKMQSAPVVFLQYLSAMAVVRGIKSYAKGYENIPVKLKWPNDVCTYTKHYPFPSSTSKLTTPSHNRRPRPGRPNPKTLHKNLRYPNKQPLHEQRIHLSGRNWSQRHKRLPHNGTHNPRTKIRQSRQRSRKPSNAGEAPRANPYYLRVSVYAIPAHRFRPRL